MEVIGQVRTYVTHSITTTALQTLREMKQGLLLAPQQGISLAARDVRIEYVHTKLGLLWAFLEPLAIAAVFVVLRRNGAMSVQEASIPYALYSVCGILIWQSFLDSLLLGLSAIERLKSLAGNYAISPEAFIAAMLYRGIFMLLIRLPIILGVSFFVGAFDWLGVFVFIVLSPVSVFTGLAFGLLLSPFTIASGDLKLAVGVSARPLLFLSGAIFPLSGSLAIFSAVNPIAIIIENLRFFLVEQQFTNGILFASVIVSSLAVFSFAWFAYHRTIRVFG